MNITIKDCLFELFLKSHGGDKGEGWKILGYIFFRVGIGIGFLFLFEEFFPLIGHVKGGASISSLLLFGGAVLLFLNRETKPLSHETEREHSQGIFNDMDIEEH